MQKPFKFFFSLLCLPVLFGCQNVDITVNDGNKFHIMRSVDNHSHTRAATISFNASGTPATAEDIVRRVDYGEEVLFVYTKDDCSSCKSFLKNAGKFLHYSEYKISVIDEGTNAAAETINNYVIENGIKRVFAHPMSGGTPSIYVMNKERIVELAYGSNDNDEKILTTAFNEYLTQTKVTYCGLNNWLNLYNGDCRPIYGTTYVLSEQSEEFFYTYAYPRALASGKAFHVLDIKGFKKTNSYMKKLYEIAGTEDIEGKILEFIEVPINDPEYSDEYERAITVVDDDVQSYLEEKYPISSSL